MRFYRALLLILAGLAACQTAAVRSSPGAPARKFPTRELARPLTLAPEAPPPAVKVLEKDPQGCTWVESEGTVTASERESPEQARAAAVSEARIAAMREFLGVEVRSKFMDFQQEGLRGESRLTEDILQTTRNGRILKEVVAAKGYLRLEGCDNCRYFVKLRTCLVPISEAADKDFHVELKLSRTLFQEGDEAQLSVTPTRDSYIYLYDVGMDWETMMIVPNEIIPEVRLKAGQTWRYPDAEAQKRGVRLVAQLPESRPPLSAETIRVIATKVPLSEIMRAPKDEGYLGILRRMNSSKIVDWAEDAQAFTIYPAEK